MPYDIIIGRDEEDRKKFGERGAVFIGRSYVKMGQVTSLANNVFLDMVRPHVILLSGKRGCLTGDTLILTDKGYKQIKKFNEKEDKVLSFNKASKKFEWETAKFLEYPIYNESLLKIKFENDKEIKLTKEHPLLAVTGEKLLSLLWLEANKLKVGDSILSIGKSLEDLIPLKIKEVLEIRGIKKVYDLRVSKNNSFIANGIISHNSGKSYSISVIAESIAELPKEISENLSVIIFDTMGIFWTMKFPNKRQEKLLNKWNLGSKGFDVSIFTPSGFYELYKSKGIPTDYKFEIKTSELSSGDWCDVLNVNIIEPVGLLISRAVEKLKGNYSIQDIIEEIKKDKKSEQKVKDAAESMFLTVNKWGLFSKKGTEIKDLIKPSKVSIIDVSCYTEVGGGWSIKALVIGLICRKLLRERISVRKMEEYNEIRYGTKLTGDKRKKELPQVWICIDEAHKVLSKYEKTPATYDLIRLLREGRQPGISLVLATQQPGVVHNDVLTQSDIVISHRVTAKPDIDALNSIMQTYLIKDLQTYLNNLPKLKGSAIILDDNSERIYPMRVRPKKSWHGGEAPSAIKISKKEEIEKL